MRIPYFKGVPALTAVAILFTVGIVGVTNVTRVDANHASAANEITASSAAAGGTVTLGNTFDVALAVTTSTNAYKGIQWQLAYGANISYQGTTVYNCPQFPSLSETPPSEGSADSFGLTGLSGLTILGQGANCASLSGSFTGSTATGTFVTVTLQCNSNGTSPVFAVRATVDAQADPFFGTALVDQFGSNITTTLENQFSAGSYGNQSGFQVTCGSAVSPTATATATNTNTPGPTSTPAPPTATFTPCTGASCPTATQTVPPVFTRTPTPVPSTSAVPGESATPGSGGETPPVPGTTPGGGGPEGVVTGPDTGSGGFLGRGDHDATTASWIVGASLALAAGAAFVALRRVRVGK